MRSLIDGPDLIRQHCAADSQTDRKHALGRPGFDIAGDRTDDDTARGGIHQSFRDDQGRAAAVLLGAANWTEIDEDQVSRLMQWISGDRRYR
jgi:hypothetical protein